MLGKQILVIDDSQTVRVIVERILSSAGYDVVLANDGYEGLSKISPKTALIVLDITMPELDGYGFCEKLSELGSGFEQMPIVFLTSIENKALEILGRQYGAYLNKPVSQEQLLSTVSDLIDKSAMSLS